MREYIEFVICMINLHEYNNIWYVGLNVICWNWRTIWLTPGIAAHLYNSFSGLYPRKNIFTKTVNRNPETITVTLWMSGISTLKFWKSTWIHFLQSHTLQMIDHLEKTVGFLGIFEKTVWLGSMTTLDQHIPEVLFFNLLAWQKLQMLLMSPMTILYSRQSISCW